MAIQTTAPVKVEQTQKKKNTIKLFIINASGEVESIDYVPVNGVTIKYIDKKLNQRH